MIQRVLLNGQANQTRLSNQANKWLMRTMRRECRRVSVKAVHAYEDCSLWAFEEAKGLGKACIYDMPIGYYHAWKERQDALMRTYADWLPSGRPAARFCVSVEQKEREMELADLVLAPSSFVLRTIREYVDKEVRVAPYGVDAEKWFPIEEEVEPEPFRFLYVGHVSVRKGLPLLFKAWKAADIEDACLDLVGLWHLAERGKALLPQRIHYLGHCSPEALRSHYQRSQVLVFPSYFEGRGLVIGEAMACGLPVVASDASGASDIIDDSCGRIFAAGDLDALVECLRFFDRNRERVPAMGRAARAKAETLTWGNYRAKVAEAVRQYC